MIISNIWNMKFMFQTTNQKYTRTDLHVCHDMPCKHKATAKGFQFLNLGIHGSHRKKEKILAHLGLPSGND